MTVQSLGLQAAPPPPLHLVEEINHRVVNEYAEAISALCLAASRSSGRTAHETLALAVDRLRAHAGSHRALLPPPAGSTNLADYLEQICAAFSKASLADSEVRLSLKADDVWLDAGRCWRIGLIVAELVRNAARHGLHGRSGAISVRVVERRARVTCLVRDDGPEVIDARPGRGRRLVEALASELGGSVDWWFTSAGCMVRLQAPVEDDGVPCPT